MPSLSQKVIQFNNSKKAKCPYNKPHMSNSSDINNFDIFDNTPFQKYKCNRVSEAARASFFNNLKNCIPVYLFVL